MVLEIQSARSQISSDTAFPVEDWIFFSTESFLLTLSAKSELLVSLQSHPLGDKAQRIRYGLNFLLAVRRPSRHGDR